MDPGRHDAHQHPHGSSGIDSGEGYRSEQPQVAMVEVATFHWAAHSSVAARQIRMAISPRLAAMTLENGFFRGMVLNRRTTCGRSLFMALQ